ncbi:TPA: hypothetical protein HJL70_003948 [Escherichia coli]|nr:hypothetical protein [Escherichia coli]
MMTDKNKRLDYLKMYSCGHLGGLAGNPGETNIVKHFSSIYVRSDCSDIQAAEGLTVKAILENSAFKITFRMESEG